MKNTGIEYLSSERTPTVLPELSKLLPPLSVEQLSLLEADIIRNGCYSPIIVNEDLAIVDGHNRFTLCEQHGLPYRMAVFAYEDMLEAKQWALNTQKSRRNLEKWELGKIALKLKPDIEARAKANMSAGGGDQKSEDAKSGLTTLSDPIPNIVSTRKELADSVGIGEVTMGKVMQIDEHAPELIKAALDSGDISINQGYNITKQIQDLPEDEQEHAAMQTVKYEIARKAEKKANARLDENTKIARQFCAAFEKAILVDPSEENIQTWFEHAGIRMDMLDDMIADARQIAESFFTIAAVLETKIKPEKWRNKDEQETDDSD